MENQTRSVAGRAGGENFCHTASCVPLGKRRNRPQCGHAEAAFKVFRRVHQYFAGLPAAAGVPVLRDAAGRFHHQQGAGRFVQRGLLQVVLLRRPVQIHQHRAADRFLRGAHGQRAVAPGSGARPPRDSACPRSPARWRQNSAPWRRSCSA